MKNKDFNFEVAERLKWLRKNNSLSQATVAEALGLQPAAYSKIENATQGLTSANCVKLAMLFGVSCDFILRGNYEVNAIMFTEKNLQKASEMLADISALLCNTSFRMVETDVGSTEEVRS